MERVNSEIVYEGPIASVAREHWRHDDGDVVEREVVLHPGAVAIVAHGDDAVILVRQPREAVGKPDLLEVPAGKLDVAGEPPVECAKRELREEVGLEAETWTETKMIWTSPGFARERVYLFEATGLTEVGAEPDEGEKIEIVRWPLSDLDEAIAECTDAKSLIGLLMLREAQAALASL